MSEENNVNQENGEVVELQEEIKTENEILKKALAIFSRQQKIK